MKVEEYVYEEENYIKRKDLKDYSDLMMEFDFAPEEIEDDVEFNMTFQYLVNLTIKAPDFLSAYEDCLRMIACLEPEPELVALQKELESKLVASCLRIAEKENIFSKVVPWGWQENRPLIRGLFFEANRLWGEGKIADAHELFSKILRTNKADNIGARYSVKATGEGVTLEEFEERFTYSDANGTYYKNEELEKWFGE